MTNYLDNKFVFYRCKELNPEDSDPSFFKFDNKPVLEGTAIECNNSGFRMIEGK